jgi:23S rRNA (uracil1939-C5)-methyltransferase
MSANSNNAPCEKGQTYAMKITDLNHQGDGVGKIEGFTLFVPLALPGEDVQVEVTALHKNYGEAQIKIIEKPSADRVEPLCPYFGVCGGCQLQHFAYDKQLSWKQNMVTETLRRIAGIEAPVLPIIAMDNPWHYRNKAQIHIANIKGRVVTGFYEQGSHNIIDLKQCPVQHPVNEEMIIILRRALQKYSEQSGETTVSGVPIISAVIRASFESGQCIIALNASPGRTYINRSKQLASLIALEAGSKVAGIVLLHPGKKAGITVLAGQSNLEEIVDPFRYQVSPHSFFQVNPQQAKKLYECAASFSGNPLTAYDLYCGTGNFSLYLSRVAKKVIGVDSEKSAIEDATVNAALNKISNISFVNARAEAISALLQKGEHPVTIFLNPPRKGCSPALIADVIKAKPERIVYISCNPATLARDLGLLQKAEFTTQKVQPLDMFPHTSHVETVVLMSRVDK